MRRTRPRLAGIPLRALARLLATPVVGRRVAERLMNDMVLDELRRLAPSDALVRPVVQFRAAPRPPPDPGRMPDD